MEVNVKLLDDVKFEIGARSHTVVSDQPQQNGGHDEGMTPPELFLAALGSCAAFYASAYLRKKNLPREGVEVRVTAEKAGPPARLDNFKIEVHVPLPLSEADRIGIEQAVHHCVIHNTMLHPPTINFELHSPVVA
jgi:uncharacterized OsmC-like protein